MATTPIPSNDSLVFFATVRLTETVHAQALGFTDTIYPYIDANDAEEARAVAERALAKKGLSVKSFSASPALQQDRKKYAFAEQIWR